jgi:hypothetical protein
MRVKHNIGHYEVAKTLNCLERTDVWKIFKGQNAPKILTDICDKTKLKAFLITAVPLTKHRRIANQTF